jgi:hypothetical protein
VEIEETENAPEQPVTAPLEEEESADTEPNDDIHIEWAGYI